jgi:hypothetical protein
VRKENSHSTPCFTCRRRKKKQAARNARSSSAPRKSPTIAPVGVSDLDCADTGGELVSDEAADRDMAFELVARTDAIEPPDVCDTTPAPAPEEVDGEPGGRETGVLMKVTVAPDLSVVTVVPIVTSVISSVPHPLSSAPRRLLNPCCPVLQTVVPGVPQILCFLVLP